MGTNSNCILLSQINDNKKCSTHGLLILGFLTIEMCLTMGHIINVFLS